MDMGIRPDMFVQGCAPRRLTSGSRRGNARVFSRYWSASASCHRCSSTSRWCGVGGRWGQPPRETRHRRSVGSRRFGLVRTRTGALVAPAHLGHEAWPLWALLTACAAGGQILEQRTACGKYTSAPLLAMLLALGLAVVGGCPFSTTCTVLYGLPPCSPLALTATGRETSVTLLVLLARNYRASLPDFLHIRRAHVFCRLSTDGVRGVRRRLEIPASHRCYAISPRGGPQQRPKLGHCGARRLCGRCCGNHCWDSGSLDACG
jgi:hypothetical protein